MQYCLKYSAGEKAMWELLFKIKIKKSDFYVRPGGDYALLLCSSPQQQ